MVEEGAKPARAVVKDRQRSAHSFHDFGGSRPAVVYALLCRGRPTCFDLLHASGFAEGTSISHQKKKTQQREQVQQVFTNSRVSNIEDRSGVGERRRTLDYRSSSVASSACSRTKLGVRYTERQGRTVGECLIALFKTGSDRKRRQ